MKTFRALPLLALSMALALPAGGALAQAYGAETYPYPDRGYDDYRAPGGQYDYARVVRVDPVFAQGRGDRTSDARCRTQRDGYASRDPYRDGDYRDDRYRDNGYRGQDPYRDTRRDENGRLVATVLGGIAGAVLGSKVGDGSGQYIGTAVGTMVGGMAGRGIYDANRRQRDAYVTVCDPEPSYGDGYYNTGDRGVSEYDVTYEYAGRHYTTRTNYHPGDRIRVRVDVRAE